MTEGMLAPVLAVAGEGWSADDRRRVVRACRVAKRLHDGQRRRSGDPYIRHPVEVAAIVAKGGAGPDTVCAALLHDVIDDTPYTIQRMRVDFGRGVADRVTALSSLTAAGIASAERDVLLLKLADRLHNMRTIQFVAPDKQWNKSAETLRTLVPLARRLGMPDMGRELSELSCRVLYGGKRGLFSSALRAAVAVLPREVRARWLAEWTAELATLPTRRSKARFVAGLIVGMPRFASILRGPTKPHRHIATVAKLVVSMAVGGTWVTVTINPAVLWALAMAVVGCLFLGGAVLFATSDKPARRLREFIESWRDSRPRKD
jgi:hypothetical protein